MSVLLDPLRYDFLRHALVVCTVAGALCGLLGVYVTLKGMSYLGHGLSHAVFAGAAIAAALAVSPVAGAGAWGLGSGLLIGRVTRGRIIGSDAAIGLVTTASFALGVALLGLDARVRRSIEASVFGSVLGVTTGDTVLVLGVAAVTVVAVVACYRPLLFTTFDPEVARASGVPTDRMESLLMLLLCAAVLTGMKVLGVTLIAAAIVVPPVTARLLTDSFHRMLVLSTALGAAGGLVGTYVSYHLDVSSGATVVLVDVAVAAVAFMATARRRRYLAV